ncbi:hypothetical protein [Cupriavidus sp. BIS7]|uniref:hypothetical protein n=1 Tax=Cupriavidus sp. BIS7 TaxID=1217718 RepID=UPI00031C0B73|nr:hypothetical protein [Cupriavidus sp. BIS7]
MKALLSKLFGTGVTKTHSTRAVDPNEPFVINLYDDRVVVHRPDGQREELAWDALEKVVVRVSDRAPWAGRAWLILAGDAASHQGCVVPMNAANSDALVRRLQALPGFHQQKLDNALRDAAASKSRTDANLWKRSEAEASAQQDEEASHDATGQH